MMLLGRASLVIMLVVMLALLALVRPIAALDASPSAILTNPAGFDGNERNNLGDDHQPPRWRA